MTRAGFDAFVGNPPFLGGKRISTVHGDRYKEWLAVVHEASNGSSDIVAHFYRRTFDLLAGDSAFGLLATNTIAQGDTRATGLRWICTHGGVIYDATRRYVWKGTAQVVTSIVHVHKEPRRQRQRHLDGSPVQRITAFLFHDGGDEDPIPLKENANKSFVGSYILGMGFTFDDANPDATPTAEMSRIIENDPRSAERILPYLGGDELNTSPTQSHRRWVIDFGGLDEAAARSYRDLFAIVEAKVRPQRLAAAEEVAAFPFWQFWNARKNLYETIRPLDRVLAIARVSDSFAITFVPARQVFSEQLIVFAYDDNAAFGILQSRVHEAWARFFASTMGDGLRYTPTDSFETFPIPPFTAAIAEAGAAYHERRAAVMVGRGEGLTAIYGRFHDPDESSTDIVELRELHAALDRAVLEAYGWSDLRVEATFIEVPADDEETARKSTRRKRSFRLRWPDETRDVVLARLLALNGERARAEAAAAPRIPPRKAAPRASARKTKRSAG